MENHSSHACNRHQPPNSNCRHVLVALGCTAHTCRADGPMINDLVHRLPGALYHSDGLPYMGEPIEASQHPISLRIVRQLLPQIGHFALPVCNETHSPSAPGFCPHQQRYTLTCWSCRNWPDKHLRPCAMLPALKYSLSHFLRAFSSGPVSSGTYNLTCWSCCNWPDKHIRPWAIPPT